jgi:hypothetical protein
LRAKKNSEGESNRIGDILPPPFVRIGDILSPGVRSYRRHPIAGRSFQVG